MMHTPIEDGGVYHAVIQNTINLGISGTLLRVVLPFTAPHLPLGQFFLARTCADNLIERQTAWSLYVRRPLFVADALPRNVDGLFEWSLLLTAPTSAHEDAGDRWLRYQPPGTRLNLTGPFGQPPTFGPQQRALLVLADLRRLPLCLPAIHHILDQGGRATLILVSADAPPPNLLQRVPLPVEVRTASDIARAQEELSATLRWADALLVALPELSTTWLGQAVRLARFRLEPGFAHLYAQADYLCGYGACLACSVPAGDGFTRACQHGPFLPLDTLTG